MGGILFFKEGGMIKFTNITKSQALPRRTQMSKKTQIQVVNRDKFRCCSCFRPTPIKKITTRVSLIKGIFHHIIPLCYGGSNSHLNICILCSYCHRKIHSSDEIKEKYSKHFEEFYLSSKITLEK